MGTSGPRPRAVIFDWGGTLTPWHAVDLAEQWTVYAQALHRDDDPAIDDLAARILAARILAAEDAAWQRARTGRGSAHMDDLLREVGLDPADASHAAALAAYRQFWEPHTFTDKQVRPLWEGLRERRGVEPAEVVYVGDRPFEDVHGSQVAGMRAIWVPHSTIPVAQQVSVEVIPDGVAYELLDILGIVDGWLSR